MNTATHVKIAKFSKNNQLDIELMKAELAKACAEEQARLNLLVERVAPVMQAMFDQVPTMVTKYCTSKAIASLAANGVNLDSQEQMDECLEGISMWLQINTTATKGKGGGRFYGASKAIGRKV